MCRDAISADSQKRSLRALRERCSTSIVTASIYAPVSQRKTTKTRTSRGMRFIICAPNKTLTWANEHSAVASTPCRAKNNSSPRSMKVSPKLPCSASWYNTWGLCNTGENGRTQTVQQGTKEETGNKITKAVVCT